MISLMKEIIFKHFLTAGLCVGIFAGCDTTPEKPVEAIELDSVEAVRRAKEIESGISAELADGLAITLWASDSLVADPVSIFVDKDGALYYTRTHRQKHSEFEIRAHAPWETPSIAFNSVDDRRNFLKTTLAPEKSESNKWLEDLNHDGSHDWRDLTVEQEEIYKVIDRNHDGVADHAQLVTRDFNTEVTDVAGAILKDGNDLFIGVSPDLWRLTDKDNDGVYEQKTSISNGYGVHIGFGGHGMSGLEIGPEGKLYWQIGDLGFVGKDAKGKEYNYPHTGVIVRCNPDGSDFEVFAYGNRNTHEFVFDDYGNLITVDNDGDHAGETERLVYVVDGADLGWRINWQFGKYRDPDNNRYKVWMDERMYVPYFKEQAAYILPPLANFISGPTGMLYNPGTALSAEWKNTFFVGEFVGNPSQSGIHSFKLKNKGASFELYDHKQFVKGVLATGVDFGPDGAMYLADWIQGWGTKNFGRVWRVDVSTPDMEIRNSTLALLQKDFTVTGINDLAKLLQHDDKRVRHKAQFELVRRGDEGLKIFETTLKNSPHQLASIHSIWGIAQLAAKKPAYANVLTTLLTDSDPELRAQAARWLGEIRYESAASSILSLVADTSDRVKFFAVQALGRMAYKPAMEAIVTMLRDNNDKDTYLRHCGSLALARIGDADKITALASDRSPAVRMAAVVALRRMAHPGVAKFLNDSDELIVTEAARAINDDKGIQPALQALADVLKTTRFKNEPLIRRAINANLEVGSDDALKVLLDFSKRVDMPVAMRVEAIAAISTWAKPSVLDRVDGQYRGESTRDPNRTIEVAEEPLGKMVSDKDKKIRIGAVSAIGKLQIKSADQHLLNTLTMDGDPEVRLAALKAIDVLKSPLIDKSVKVAIKDKEVSIRAAALSLLSKTSLPSGEKVAILRDIIRNRTIEERQAAINALGDQAEADRLPVLKELLTLAESSKLPLELNIEFEEAIMESKSTELVGRFQKLKNSATDTLLFSYRGVLSGGDPEKGRSVFFNNDNAQCLRCHSFDDLGGNAGPRLNGVASRLSREQILEALITPSKRIAPGFGVVTIELKNGKKISGTLQSEKEDALTIKSGQKADTVIRRSDINTSTVSGSSMPPMYLLLSKKEMRDLVSFLSTLKQ
jgi:quinoprotein glucose dehydrogenase